MKMFVNFMLFVSFISFCILGLLIAVFTGAIWAAFYYSLFN